MQQRGDFEGVRSRACAGAVSDEKIGADDRQLNNSASSPTNRASPAAAVVGWDPEDEWLVRLEAPRSRFGTEGVLLECDVRPIGRDAIILVVEDDPELRNLYRAALRSAGYAVFAVDDGIDALEYVEQTMPAAIVLDLGLPRLDGRDVQRELAAQGHTERIPIVVVTGQTEGINEGDFACVLRKPVEPEALVGAVQNCLDRWK